MNPEITLDFRSEELNAIFVLQQLSQRKNAIENKEKKGHDLPQTSWLPIKKEEVDSHNSECFVPADIQVEAAFFDISSPIKEELVVTSDDNGYSSCPTEVDPFVHEEVVEGSYEDKSNPGLDLMIFNESNKVSSACAKEEILLDHGSNDSSTADDNNSIDSNVNFVTSNFYRQRSAGAKSEKAKRKCNAKRQIFLQEDITRGNHLIREMSPAKGEKFEVVSESSGYDSPSEVMSSGTSSNTSRPKRECANRFNQRLAEGLFSSFVGEDKVLPPKHEKSKCRKRHSSMSSQWVSPEQTFLTTELMKYRERRARNNLASMKSREKRKRSLQLMTVELGVLEEENKRLQKEEVRLRKLLAKVDRIVKVCNCTEHHTKEFHRSKGISNTASLYHFYDHRIVKERVQVIEPEPFKAQGISEPISNNKYLCSV